MSLGTDLFHNARAAVPPAVGVTGHCAAFIAATPGIVLPVNEQRATCRAFVNWVGCALGAANDTSLEPVFAVARSLSGREQASMVGRGERVDVMNAALVNGSLANALDFDDMHVPTLIHPTGAVVAAALAAGEDRRASGKLLLSAIATQVRPLKALRYLSCFSILLLSGSAIAAEAFPAKPLRMIVGFPPGGAVDILARTVAPPLAETLGGQVVVDNRGGANGIIGAELVAKAAPDGYTIGLVSVSSMVLNVHMYKNIPYHTLRDFTPLPTVGLVPFAIAVHPGVPARSLKDLIALARSKPGMLTFGTPGIGGLQHLTVEMLNSVAKIRLEHVPYKGTGPALTDVVGGHIDGMVTAIPGLIAPARNGKLRVLAITGAARSPALPDVPTAREQGLADFVVVSWYAIVAPPNMTSPLANTLHAAIVKVVAVPAVSEKLVAAGVDPRTDASPAAFAQFVREEFARWGSVVRDSGVKVE